MGIILAAELQAKAVLMPGGDSDALPHFGRSLALAAIGRFQEGAVVGIVVGLGRKGHGYHRLQQQGLMTTVGRFRAQRCIGTVVGIADIPSLIHVVFGVDEGIFKPSVLNKIGAQGHRDLAPVSRLKGRLGRQIVHQFRVMVIVVESQ